MKTQLILVNPWIYDFAAYDLWSKPLGMLYLAAYLKHHGFDIHIIDCLDIHHPQMEASFTLIAPVRRPFGTGKFWRQKIEKPPVLAHIPRSYSRYGITEQLFINELKMIRDPAAVLVTSLMTYWYPGVQESIRLIKKVHPSVPIILGGVYAKLCPEHARECSGADTVTGEGNLHRLDIILHVLARHGITPPVSSRPSGDIPYPAYDMLRKIDYVCILTSLGCPYQCHYCASGFLNAHFCQRDPDAVVAEICYWHKEYNVCDFAFYDDALLVGSETHAVVILEKLLRHHLPVRFHTPNALHIREITPKLSVLLRRAGFCTIRLGLETADMTYRNGMDHKVNEGDFEKAIQALKQAGFQKGEIGAYILMGLPEQSIDSVSRTITFVKDAGVLPFLAEYSPLPHTVLWERARNCSHYDLLSEPLFHNNSLLPCWSREQRKVVPVLRAQVREARRTC